ncbi:UbiA prenyltransferase family-domain-containing protein [Xylariaceae sp. FL0804]|nr:UbiA prenyltransferase family-domain-containing protein [Xylariaceae sp. FL0804]
MEKSLSSSREKFVNSGVAQQYGGGHVGGWVGRLPASWVPYVQLARLSPPAALFLIYFPHLFGALLAAIVQVQQQPQGGPGLPPRDLLRAAAALLLGSLFFSNAAHGWNDAVDAPVDRRVARTASRPIPRGALSVRAALVFTASQAALALAVLLCLLPRGSAAYALPNAAATAYYPWAKRHTNLAQLVLGACLAWGVVVGSCAAGLRPFTFGSGPFGRNEEEDGFGFGFGGGKFDNNNNKLWVHPAMACLFGACVLWTVIYDTVYAHQDRRDDVRAGLKSIAVLCGPDRTKRVLWLALAAMLALLAAVGPLAGGGGGGEGEGEGLGPAWYVVAIGGSAISLGVMIGRVELASSASCWWWFRHGFWLAGGSIAIALLLEYLRVADVLPDAAAAAAALGASSFPWW